MNLNGMNSNLENSRKKYKTKQYECVCVCVFEKRIK